MDLEDLQKAKKLENDINEYKGLIESKDASYNYMLVKISPANTNKGYEYDGRLDKEIWKKMLNVLEEELQEKYKQLEKL